MKRTHARRPRREPDTDTVLPNSLSDRIDDLHREPRHVLRRTTVLVRPFVPRRREKLFIDVAIASMNLDLEP